jgi:hypothetical protein
MRDEADDGRATGMICAKDLAEKDPKRYQGRVNSVFPNHTSSRHRLRYDVS